MPINELIARAAREGAKIKKQGRMCNDCAFKLNSEANKEEHTCESVMEVFLMGGKFNCHEGIGVDAGKPCQGFLYAKQYYDSIED